MKTENVDKGVYLTFSIWNKVGNYDLIWDEPTNTKRKENRFYKTKKKMERKVISDCVCVCVIIGV